MKAKVLTLGALLAIAPCLAVWDARAAEPGLDGNWITDAVLTARQMQAKLREALKTGEIDPFDDSPVGQAYRNQVNANQVNGNSGNSSSATSSPAGRSAPTGGRSGGGGGAPGGGGGFGGGGGGRGGRGNNFLPAMPQDDKRGAAKSTETGAVKSATTGKTKPAATDEDPKELSGPAITLELKAAKTKLTGNITEIAAEDLKDDKVKIEDGEIAGNKFKFVTYKKAGGMQLPIRWEGEITSEKSMKLTRKNSSGKVLDQVGELILTRVK